MSSVIDANAHAFLFAFTQLKNLVIFRRARILTFVNISHLELCKYEKNAHTFASITELIAQKARTLWGNVHSCTKLFNMLNIRRWWHEWRKSQNTTPHTWGISLRQQAGVTLSSADSSSVRRALRNNDGNNIEVIWNLHIQREKTVILARTMHTLYVRLLILTYFFDVNN